MHLFTTHLSPILEEDLEGSCNGFIYDDCESSSLESGRGTPVDPCGPQEAEAIAARLRELEAFVASVRQEEDGLDETAVAKAATEPMPQLELGPLRSCMKGRDMVQLTWTYPSPSPVHLIGFCLYAKMAPRYDMPGWDTFELVQIYRTNTAELQLDVQASSYQFSVSPLPFRFG
eukprot:TRINITY_DN4259_c0_g1_i1.p1 TRINITY_DN4259_c0_g1~~TRINITY_DN4259_c0_g1_i1.p1  ORF type:complete len:174 (+),score=50.38 TRINITY_DN4259_c0_g1_i1:221-742(+)